MAPRLSWNTANVITGEGLDVKVSTKGAPVTPTVTMALVVWSSTWMSTMYWPGDPAVYVTVYSASVTPVLTTVFDRAETLPVRDAVTVMFTCGRKRSMPLLAANPSDCEPHLGVGLPNLSKYFTTNLTAVEAAGPPETPTPLKVDTCGEGSAPNTSRSVMVNSVNGTAGSEEDSDVSKDHTPAVCTVHTSWDSCSAMPCTESNSLAVTPLLCRVRSGTMRSMKLRGGVLCGLSNVSKAKMLSG
mmetsp:Transcript_27896/g.46732  ORF Transcript_27896/g.46732 Transcript_27896/m.46732 type:complete len:243 (+) Transcript_27896:4115-4843(+)